MGQTVGRPRLLPCLDCGRLSAGSRCPACHRRRYGPAWQARSRAERAAQPWCARCGATTDLVLDHKVPGLGDAVTEVLCRRCNLLKGPGL